MNKVELRFRPKSLRNQLTSRSEPDSQEWPHLHTARMNISGVWGPFYASQKALDVDDGAHLDGALDLICASGENAFSDTLDAEFHFIFNEEQRAPQEVIAYIVVPSTQFLSASICLHSGVQTINFKVMTRSDLVQTEGGYRMGHAGLVMKPGKHKLQVTRLEMSTGEMKLGETSL